MTAEGRTQPLPGGSDDAPIDIAAYVRLVWRRRVTVAVATAACIAIALIVHRIYPPTFEARAIIQHGHPVGSAAASDVVARSLALLGDPAVYEHVVKLLSLDAPPRGMSAAELKHATTFRAEVPVVGVMVLVRVSHADLAARIAGAVAGRIAHVIGEQDTALRAVARATLQADLGDASGFLAAAQQQLAEFRKTHQAALAELDRQTLERQRLEVERQHLESASVAIVGEEAFLRFLEKQLADNPRQAELHTAATISRGRIASLEATRDYLRRAQAKSVVRESAQSGVAGELSELEAAVARDQRARDQLLEATIQARRAKPAVRPTVGPVDPGQFAGTSASSVAARALLIGLLLSVAGVLLSHFLLSAWRTRTGH